MPQNSDTSRKFFDIAFSKKNLQALLVILVVTFIAYAPSLKNGFISLDDDTHVYENPAIRVLDAPHIQQIFTTTVNKIYTPLTFLSFAIEYHFFKYNPFIYHLNNLILHLGVTALIFWLALQFGLPLRACFIAGLLFGIHPMHVESVAWITERKDVLYAFFYMLALCCYWQYLSDRKPKLYLATIICGLLSILAKPMALSLPLIMLLLDWIKRRRFDKAMIMDKIPHFLYIVPIAWITYSLNARVPGENIFSGILIWIWTAMFYIHKFFFPAVLVPMYALPEPVSLSNPQYIFAVILLGLIITVLVLKKRQRWLWVAVLFYFFSMFFLFRYDAVADKNIVADRFMYLPCVGICYALGHFLNCFLQNNSKYERPLQITLIVIAALLAGKTFNQTHIWHDSITFWTHELKYYPDNALAYGNRGEAYRDLGKFDLAMADFNKSIEVDPNYAESYNSRGQMHGMSGNTEAALQDFKRAIELNPRFDEAYNNIGIIYAMRNERGKALVHFEKAVEIDPYNLQANYNLGDLYYAKGNFDTAFEYFQKVLTIDPHSALGYNKRGLIYGIRKQYALALADLDRSLAIDPRNSEVYKNRGVILEHMTRYPEALVSYDRAIKLNPKFADAYHARGNVKAKTGHYGEAAKDFQAALAIDPEHQGAKRSQRALAKLLTEQNKNSDRKE